MFDVMMMYFIVIDNQLVSYYRCSLDEVFWIVWVLEGLVLGSINCYSNNFKTCL